MARRRGLSEAEILAELQRSSPTQSEDSNCDLSDDGGDLDYLPPQRNNTSSSSDESEDHLESRPTTPLPSTSQKSDQPGPASAALSDGRSQRGGKTKAVQARSRGRFAVSVDDAASAAGSENQGGDISRNNKKRSDATKVNGPKVGDIDKSADGIPWVRVAPGNSQGRRSGQNVLKETCGPTGHAKRYIDKDSPVTAWRLFVSEPILKLIKLCTETEARNQLGNNDWSITMEELDAFISLLYVRGAYGARALNYKSLWDMEWGPPFFTKTMSKHRFKEIMKYLRFDIRATRQQRKETDKFCLARDLWEKFTDNCIACYLPSENLTVDEQLYPCKSRCPFIQYMPQKPDKYGIKFWLVCDAEHRYVLNGFPYLGKDEERPADRSLGEHVVLKLAHPFLNKGRNITCDNFFTSTKLADELKKKNTSLVGTVRKQKREVPQSIRNPKDLLYSTVLFKHEDKLLTSYQGKKHKNVVVLSTVHTGCLIDETKEKKLPETIQYYNQTKGGVDVVDQMSRLYSVRAATRRWPIHIFYNVLDLAMINAHTIYNFVTGKSVDRRDFILQCCTELALPYRMQKQVNAVIPNAGTQGNKRKRCQVSATCGGNKTKDVCSRCQKFVCGGCKSKNITCLNCESNDD